MRRSSRTTAPKRHGHTLFRLARLVERIQSLPGARLFLPVSVYGLWVGLLVAIELWGREWTGEGGDLLLGLVLIFGTATLHRLHRLAWLQVLDRKLGQAWMWLKTKHYQFGVDFRGQPAVTHGVPREITRFSLTTAGVCLVLAVAAAAFPSGLRDLLRPISVNLYLAYVLVLLCGLLVVEFSALFLIVSTVRDFFLARYTGQGSRPRWPEWSVLAGIGLVLCVAAAWLPLAVPLSVVVAGAVGTVVLSATTSTGCNLLWRREVGSMIYVLDARVLILHYWTSALLLPVCFLFLTIGERVVPATSSDSAFALQCLGGVLAWTLLPATVVAIYQICLFAYAGLRYRLQHEQAVWQALPEAERRGWEIAQRRAIRRGLERLFKRKARLKNPPGTGVWIAPQYWFIPGMTRDETAHSDEEGVLDRIIGPHYHRLLPSAARFHLWQVCRATEVDLILVEDGISFRRFMRVIATLYELYDMHGGTVRAEDRHFFGLPGVKVLVHEFLLATEEELNVSGYPEPDYDEIGAARILHIFKDRGDTQETVEPPFEWDDVPVFSGV